jgi:ankyrin repeat protein
MVSFFENLIEYFQNQYKDFDVNFESIEKQATTEAAIEFLRIKRNPNEIGTDGDTPLITLSEVGNIELVMAFVQAGADANILNDINNYALLAAAERQHQDVFKYLLPLTNCKLRKLVIEAIKIGTNYSLRDRDRLEYHILLEVFTESALRGQIEKLEKTINKGVFINDLNSNGQSALHNAVMGHQLEAIKILLNRGAFPRLENSQGKTPIDVAASSRNIYPEIHATLVKANISFEYFQEELFYRHIGIGLNGEELWQKIVNEAGMNFLEENLNPDPNERLSGGYTPLMNIASVGAINLVRRFIEIGADVNILDEINSYALLESAYKGHKEVFSFLLPLTSEDLRQKAIDVLPVGISYRQKRQITK